MHSLILTITIPGTQRSQAKSIKPWTVDRSCKIRIDRQECYLHEIRRWVDEESLNCTCIVRTYKIQIQCSRVYRESNDLDSTHILGRNAGVENLNYRQTEFELWKWLRLSQSKSFAWRWGGLSLRVFHNVWEACQPALFQLHGLGKPLALARSGIPQWHSANIVFLKILHTVLKGVWSLLSRTCPAWWAIAKLFSFWEDTCIQKKSAKKVQLLTQFFGKHGV